MSEREDDLDPVVDDQAPETFLPRARVHVADGPAAGWEVVVPLEADGRPLRVTQIAMGNHGPVALWNPHGHLPHPDCVCEWTSYVAQPVGPASGADADGLGAVGTAWEYVAAR